MTSACTFAMSAWLLMLAPKPGATVTIKSSVARSMGYTERDIPQGMRCCKEKRLHCKIDWTR